VSATRPNLILVMTDDQAVWSIGAYGHPDPVTPTLDRLAEQGAFVRWAFAAEPVCSPSRASLFSGLWSTENGLHDVFSMREYGGLPEAVPFWPSVVREHGWTTGLIGKWHLGMEPFNHPLERGFDHFFGFRTGANRPMNPVLQRGDEEPRLHRGSLPDILTDEAIDFVDAHADEPFALCLTYRAPHGPHLPVPDEDLAPFRGRDIEVPMVPPEVAVLDDDLDQPTPETIAFYTEVVRERLRGYYASVHSVDRNLGRLLAHLDQRGLAGNTIVAFTSDQGYLFGHRGLKAKGNAEPIRMHHVLDYAPVLNLFDHAVRVPFLVRWPAAIEAGTQVDDLVSLVDVYRTVLGLLGIPEDEATPRSGRDASPLLRREQVAWRDTVFAQWNADGMPSGGAHLRMARTHEWKLVHNYLSPSSSRLYHLTEDPEELRNLYYNDDPDPTAFHAWLESDVPTMPRGGGNWHHLPEYRYHDVKRQLSSRLEAWLRDTGDPILDLHNRYVESMLAVRDRWSPASDEHG